MLVNAKRTFTLPEGRDDWTGLVVRVFIHETSTPARIYAASGALLANNGVTTLSPDGEFNVWLDDASIYRLELCVASSGAVLWRLDGCAVPLPEVASGGGNGGSITGAELASLISSSTAVRNAIIALATVNLNDAGDQPLGRIFPPAA